jgi:dienelactone hydrolase
MPPRPIRIADHAAALSQCFTIVKPEGQGPFPVMVQLHGCGGRQPLHDTYAALAVKAGVASVIVDSFTPRGILRQVAQMTVCTGLRLRGAERSADLFAALHWLEGQAWADQDRILAAGWSHGGWTIMDALAGAYTASGLIDGDPAALHRLHSVFLVYPYAGVPSLTATRGWGDRRPNVFAIVGTRDAVVGQLLPRRALDRVARDGAAVDVLTIEGATHAFDDPDATDPRTRYSLDHTAQAQAFFIQALNRLTPPIRNQLQA